jgi:pimeloyl-ACP methyl ester carboxylesterase
MTGPTVLLCNGLGTNPYSWPALLDAECGVRVISWYHRGTGGSARPADRHHVGIEHFVEDALAVMDDAGIAACPVLGWSMGVNTAFELAYLHPHRVTGLFAVAGVPGGTFASMLAPLLVPRFARSAITVNAARAMGVLGKPLSAVASRLPVGPLTGAVLTHSGFMLPVPDVEMVRRAVKEFLTTPIDWYMHLAVTTSRHVRVSLRAIDVPTTFVAGRWDLLASADDMRTASERIAGSTYARLNASHFVAMEKPDDVHELLLDLLDRV